MRRDFATKEDRLRKLNDLHKQIKFESILWALSITVFVTYMIYQLNNFGGYHV